MTKHILLIALSFAACIEPDPELATAEAALATPPGCSGRADLPWGMYSTPGYYVVPPTAWPAQGLTYTGECPWFFVADVINTAGKTYSISLDLAGWVARSECSLTHSALMVEGYRNGTWETLTTQAHYGTYLDGAGWCDTKLVFDQRLASPYAKLRVSVGTWTPERALPASFLVTVH